MDQPDANSNVLLSALLALAIRARVRDLGGVNT